MSRQRPAIAVASSVTTAPAAAQALTAGVLAAGRLGETGAFLPEPNPNPAHPPHPLHV